MHVDWSIVSVAINNRAWGEASALPVEEKPELNGEDAARKAEGDLVVHFPLGKIVSVVFPHKLMPGGIDAANCIESNYKPDVNHSFYDEVKKAIAHDVKFVLFLVDAYSFNADSIADTVKFCTNYKIPILSVIFSVHRGKQISWVIQKQLSPDVKTVEKPLYSIFSSHEVHQFLKYHSPGAIIIAGEKLKCCIRASIAGLKPGDDARRALTDEYGALEYGYSVYTHFGLIKDRWDVPSYRCYQRIEAERLYKFDDPDEGRPCP